MKIIKEFEQGSAEWHSVRLGMITASRMSDVLSKGRGKAPSKTAETYMIELIAERLTGEAKPFFENEAMRHGSETEPQARAMYELVSGNEVEEVAFIEHDDYVGVSPDGIIGEDGLLEIKCPNTTTQIKRFLSGKYSTDYTAQIQAQLWVSGRQWCDFVSFDPRLDVDACYLVERVERDEEYIEEMAAKVQAFVDVMKKNLVKLGQSIER